MKYELSKKYFCFLVLLRQRILQNWENGTTEPHLKKGLGAILDIRTADESDCGHAAT
jgi:hypothetical protein